MDQNSQQTVVKGKIVFVGDAGVGKTSIINYYNKINSETQPTVGANSIKCTVPYGDHIVTLNVWDTAGQENFQCLVPLFARCAQVAVIVFDISSTASFDNINSWYKQMKDNSQVPNVILCGNKCDLKQEIPTDKLNELRDNLKCEFYRTSATLGSGIDILFSAIAECVEQSNEADNQKTLPHVEFANPVEQTNHQNKCC